ncbi:MAG: adenylyl-sulfate kinase [Cyanobacteria bacterium]|nr:adenylyl-sulfate kinase [Cyanobacteriota bacterium]
MDLLRFSTAGSVDDGKSTLIGRLLHDTASICVDQYAAVVQASRSLGEDEVNLALVTDGLRAEREQKITIDVAHRYFRTARRRFIIADTPGHVQYTRNMVTGASTADLIVVVMDATRGLLTQTRRHAFLASLLGIPQMVLAVNKMDLVGYAQEPYDRIVTEFAAFANKLTIRNVSCVPVCARIGDNIVERSTRMPWYQGGPLLHLLETASAGARANTIDFRFPVQMVIRPGASFRGYAGTIASGTVSTGEEVMVLPSRLTTRIKSIAAADGATDAAAAGRAVVVTITDEIDVSRGDMLVRPGNIPDAASAVDAYLCWMDAEPLAVDKTYLLAHTTRRVQAMVTNLAYQIDVDTLHRRPAATLGMNEIGRATVVTAAPLFIDSYRLNGTTGSFVLVDPQSNATVAAGMIRGRASAASTAAAGEPAGNAPLALEPQPADRRRRAVVWLTGLSGSGKTTIARLAQARLLAETERTVLLDGDELRQGLCRDLGFSAEDRAENVRRAAEVARLFLLHGADIVLCTFISPYRRDRDYVRSLFPPETFIEVFIKADIATCRARDPKGLYARADAGGLPQFTGISDPYEEPTHAALTLDTTLLSAEAAAAVLHDFLRQQLSRRVR